MPASDIIRFARETLNHYGEDSRYRHVAYSSGLIFDILLAVLNVRMPRVKTQNLTFVETLFKESMKAADQAYSIMKQNTVVALEVSVIPTCFFRNAGRASLGILDPSYVAILKQYKSKRISTVLQHLFEENQYGVRHDVMGALLCQSFSGQSEAFFPTLFFDTLTFLNGMENNSLLELLAISQRGYGEFRSPPIVSPA